MSGALLPPPRFVVYDPATGDPLVGGLVHTYVPGGTVPADTWQDADETIPNANPIVLDSVGSCLIYGTGAYQLTVTDSLGNAIPGYSGLSYSPAFISEAMQPVVAAATVQEGFDLLAANGGTIGNPLFVAGNATIEGNFTIEGSAVIDTPLAVPFGGTGDGTLAANAILIGSGTAAVAFLSPGSAGNVPLSNGTAWQAVIPVQVQTQAAIFLVSTTWTCPTGVTQVRATVIGGGAGGSIHLVCCVTTDLSGGNGGLVIGEYTVVPTTVYTITIGAGGAGVASGASTAGATSSFASFASATGGAASSGSANGANGTGSSGAGLLRNAAAGFASGILGGAQISGSSASAAHTWTVGDPGGAGIGGAGNKGGTSGAILLEWVG